MNAIDHSESERERRFRALFESSYADVLRFTARRVAPSHREDIVAEVFLVAWRRVDELPADAGDTRAWLFGVARNVILNTRRGERRERALAVRIADDAFVAVTASEADAAATRLDLVAAWRRLPARHQEALALAVWEGLSAAQAARVLGITPVAYRLRLSRARRALRHELGDVDASSIPSPAVAERSPS